MTASPLPAVAPRTESWVVHKFGGTSLASPECYRNVLDILLDVRKQQKEEESLRNLSGALSVTNRLCVVVSAMGEVKPNSQVSQLMMKYHSNQPNYQVQKLEKVTNLLIKCTELAAANDSSYKRIFEELKRRHRSVVDEMINETVIAEYRARVEAEEQPLQDDAVKSPRSKNAAYHYSHSDHGASAATDLSLSILHMKETLRSLLERDFDDLSFILRACWLSKNYDLEHNWWFGYGELWSARLICTFINVVLLALGDGPGHSDERAVWLDAREAIVLARTHDPMPDFAVSSEKLEKWLRSSIEVSTARIVVVTGYIASGANGMPTTLGRDGSDYSASIFANLLRASSAVIWTDVDGVYSANPTQVADAVLLDELSYDEASELAYFGAKVLHPKTMTPVLAQEIPIWIKNTFNPTAPGSCIRSARVIAEREKDRSPTNASSKYRPGVAYGVKGISEISNLCLLEVKGTGVIGVPGIATRLFSRLRDASCSVILVTQAGSDLSMSIAVPMSQADRALEVVEREFRDELHTREILSVQKTGPCACLAVVGDGMRHKRGVAGRVFGALAHAGVNITAIAQGSSERNISAIISQSDVRRALLAVHAAFLSPETVVHGEEPCIKQAINHALAELASPPLTARGKNVTESLMPGAVLTELDLAAESNESSSGDDDNTDERRLVNELATNQDHQVAKLRRNYRMFTRTIVLKVCVVQGGWPLCEFDKLMAKLKESWGERKEVRVEVKMFADIRNNTVRRGDSSDSSALDWADLLSELRGWRSDDGSVLPVVVDCTDNELVTYQYRSWLKAGVRLVTQRQLQSSLSALQSVPLFATLYDMQFRGDTVTRVEAILPNALSYAFTSPAIQSSKLTRAQVIDSHRSARAAMMSIANNMGVVVEDDNITSDFALSSIDRDDLLAQALSEHRTKAANQNMQYAFVASFDAVQRRIDIGLRMCPMSHPFAWLRGQNSCICVYTKRHGTDAVVLQGPAPLSDELSPSSALTPLDNALTQFKAIVSDLAK